MHYRQSNNFHHINKQNFRNQYVSNNILNNNLNTYQNYGNNSMIQFITDKNNINSKSNTRASLISKFYKKWKKEFHMNYL